MICGPISNIDALTLYIILFICELWLIHVRHKVKEKWAEEILKKTVNCSIDPSNILLKIASLGMSRLRENIA